MAEIPLLIPNQQSPLPKNMYYVHNWLQNGGPVMRGTPGLTPWLDLSATVVDGEVRAMRYVKGYLYALIGSGVYQIDSNANYTLLGTVSTTTGSAQMVDNGSQLMIVIKDVNGYVLELTATTHIVAETTTVNTGASETDKTLVINAAPDAVIGDKVGVMLDSGNVQFVTLSAEPYDTISISTETVPSAATAGNEIWGVGSVTYLNGDAPIAATNMLTDSTTGFTVGESVFVVLDDGSIHEDVIDSIVVDTSIQMVGVAGIASAAAEGNMIFTRSSEAIGDLVVGAAAPDATLDVSTGVTTYIDTDYDIIVLKLDDASYFACNVAGTYYGTISFTEELEDDVAVDNSVYSTSDAIYGFGLIPSLNFPTPACLAYQDTYAIVVSTNTELFYISNTEDFTAWDALDYQYVERLPDLLTMGMILDGELWAFGRYSIEVYQNTGASTFPWEKIAGIDHSIGTDAPECGAVIDNSIFFKDNHNQIRRTNYHQTIIISTESIEEEISGMTTVTDAKGFGLHVLSNWWYVITFPTADKTFVYDITASSKLGGHVWYRLTSYPDESRHRINCIQDFAGKNLIGDYEKTVIWEYSDTVYKEDTEDLISELTFPKIPDGGQRIPITSFVIDADMGVGNADVESPVIMTSYSDDDGKTFINERNLYLGKVGENYNRLIRRQCGVTKRHGRLFRVRISDPAKRIIMGARVNE